MLFNAGMLPYNMRMKILLFVLLSVLSLPVHAQEPSPFPAGEILPEPLCFNIINQAPYGVYGTVSTDYYTTPDGEKKRYVSNFNLKAGEHVNFCASGPFFEGRKVDLVLRTIIPIFSCKTGVTGDVFIKGRRNAEGRAETWAECL